MICFEKNYYLCNMEKNELLVELIKNYLLFENQQTESFLNYHIRKRHLSSDKTKNVNLNRYHNIHNGTKNRQKHKRLVYI